MITPARRGASPSEGGSPPPSHPTPAGLSIRTPAGRLLRDVTQQLIEVQELLELEPQSEALSQALERLRSTREALSLLALERAAQRSAPVVTDRPAVVRRLELAPGAASAPATRAFCRETFASWSVGPELAASAVDVASELVANASTSSRSPIVLRLELREDGLLISVWDDGKGRPRLRPYRPGTSERGIGLHLVEHLSQAWGWTDEQGGKWVWARMGPGHRVDRLSPRRGARSGRRSPTPRGAGASAASPLPSGPCG